MARRTRTVTATVTRMVKVPMPINFVQIDGASVDVGRLDEETVKAIAKAWAEQLIEHAAERRKRLVKDDR